MKEKTNIIRQLRYRLIVVISIGLVLIAIFTGLSVIVPYYNYIKQVNDNQLIQLTRQRSQLINVYLKSLKDTADQITSRTFARKQLARLLSGEINQMTHNERTTPLLIDAMHKHKSIAAIIRFDLKNKAILHIGNNLSLDLIKLPDTPLQTATIYGPVQFSGQYYIYAIAPIIHNNNQFLGHDAVLFNLEELHEILVSRTGMPIDSRVQLGWANSQGRINIFFDNHKNASVAELESMKLALNNETGIYIPKNSQESFRISHSPVDDIHWGLTISIPQNIYNTPFRSEFYPVILIMLGIITLCTIIITIIIRSVSDTLFSEEKLPFLSGTKDKNPQRDDLSLDILNKIYAQLIQADTEQKLLDRTADILSNYTQFDAIWICLNDQQNDNFHCVSHAGNKHSCLDIDALCDDSDAWNHCLVSLAINKQTTITQNEVDYQLLKYWDKNCNRSDIELLATPLILENNVAGIMLAYASETSIHIKQDVNLFQNLGQSIAYGLLALRNKTRKESLQKQLLQADKMQAIGQMSSVLSHEFDNIFSYILNHTALIQASHITPETAPEIGDHLKRIKSSAQRARNQLKQLLTFSTTSTEDSRPLKLEPLLSQALSLLTPTLPSTIEIHTHIEDQTSEVLLDPIQFNQIIINLCTNARHAMSEIGIIEIGLKQVHIESTSCSSCADYFDGVYEVLIVKDNGRGISKDSINRIFDPFYSDWSYGESSGMGLSVVHGIVHEYNGHIVIDSEIDKGTEIRIYFPVSQPQQPAKKQAEISS